MAIRRMFSKDIVSTDMFKDMSASAQNLYFHLGMEADDDGFISHPKVIMKSVNASEDDIKILLTKGYVIPFESGVCVLRHWKVHNYIPKDRYKKTRYTNEKNMLEIDENSAYLPIISGKYGLYTKCIQDVYGLYKQVRLGKDRLGKDKDIYMSDSVQDFHSFYDDKLIEAEYEDITDEDYSVLNDMLNENTKPKKQSTDYQGILDLYHKYCPSLPTVQKLTEQRKSAIRARLNEDGEDKIQEVFILAEQTAFLKGDNNRGWRANFDFVMSPRGFSRILEGYYVTASKVTDEQSSYADEIERRINQ